VFYCDINCKSQFQVGKSLPPETIAKMSIANSRENNGRYKDGYTFRKHYCSCGNEKDYRSKMCRKCYKPTSFLGKKHTEENKKLIGLKSKNKFKSNDFIKRFRKTMEERGLWLPENKINDFIYYNYLSNWKEKMFDLPVDGHELLTENKLFNSKKCSDGIVRDHKFSRKNGFIFKVYPEILRHPANCELMLNSKNISKGISSSITIEELISRIILYKYDWYEQDLCIVLIDKYNKGERYDRNDY